ncbi:unnamed protein product, partial [Ilex paraguariensis]
MHLWPSMRIRDSFKQAYLKKLEWNLHRMKTEKDRQPQSSSQQKLLDDSNNGGSDISVDPTPNTKSNPGEVALVLCRELLMILSCCYCCFCCGGTHPLS